MKSKRIIAGLLILSMVISLFAPRYANNASAAGGKSLLMDIQTYVEIDTGYFEWQRGFKPNQVIKNVGERFKVTDVTIDWAPVDIIPGSAKLEFGDGRYWMDPDETIYPRVRYSIRYSFEVVDPAVFDKVEYAQVYLGQTAEHDSGYQMAELSVDGHKVTIVADAQPYGLEISKAALQSVKVNPIYRKALPERLTLLNGAPFTSGNIQWFFSDNGTIEPVSRANKMADLANNKFYYLRVTVYAKNLYEFSRELGFYNRMRPDGTTFEARVSNDGKEADIMISNIVPEVVEEELRLISGIVTNTTLSLGTLQANIVADIIPHLPKSMKVKIYGTDSYMDMPFDSIKTGADRWHVYEVSGNNIGYELSDSAVLHKSDAYEYVAIYPYSALLNDIDKAEFNDYFNIIKTYMYDVDYPGNTGHALGYAIKFSVRPENSYAYMQEALPVMETPAFDFRDYNAYIQYFASGQCACAVECVVDPVNFDFDATPTVAFPAGFAMYGVCSQQPGIYKAINRGMANYSVDSAICYEYFNPEDLKHRNMKNGAISIVTQVPRLAEHVTYDYAVAASGDYEKGLDIDDATFYWTPSPMAINSDYEQFLDATVYTAVITIPVKKGYIVEKAPDVRVNGVNATNVTVSEGEIVVRYEFPATDPEYWIDANGNCNKRLYFKTPKPYAGMTVPKTVRFSDTCSQMLKIDSLQWYEGTEPVEPGAEFKKGARYSLMLVLDMSQVGVESDLSGVDVLIGTTDYVTHAYANKETKLATIQFDFGICESADVMEVRNCELVLPRGLSTAQFMERLNNPHYTELLMSNGEVAVTTIEPGYKTSNPPVRFATFEEEFNAMYFGAFTYDEKTKKEQVFKLDAIVNIPDKGNEYITFTVTVPGEKCEIKFDANGGNYSGMDRLSVEAGKPYGFVYNAADYKREGYLFAGWFTEATGGKRIYSTSIVSDNITLYAYWIKVFTGKVYSVNTISEYKSTLKVMPKHPATKIAGYEVSISYDGKNWDSTLFTGDEVVLRDLKSGPVYIKVRAYRFDSAGMKVFGASSWPKKVTIQ